MTNTPPNAPWPFAEPAVKQETHKCAMENCGKQIHYMDVWCADCRDDLMQGAQGE